MPIDYGQLYNKYKMDSDLKHLGHCLKYVKNKLDKGNDEEKKEILKWLQTLASTN